MQSNTNDEKKPQSKPTFSPRYRNAELRLQLQQDDQNKTLTLRIIEAQYKKKISKEELDQLNLTESIQFKNVVDQISWQEFLKLLSQLRLSNQQNRKQVSHTLGLDEAGTNSLLSEIGDSLPIDNIINQIKCILDKIPDANFSRPDDPFNQPAIVNRFESQSQKFSETYDDLKEFEIISRESREPLAMAAAFGFDMVFKEAADQAEKIIIEATEQIKKLEKEIEKIQSNQSSEETIKDKRNKIVNLNKEIETHQALALCSSARRELAFEEHYNQNKLFLNIFRSGNTLNKDKVFALEKIIRCQDKIIAALKKGGDLLQISQEENSLMDFMKKHGVKDLDILDIQLLIVLLKKEAINNNQLDIEKLKENLISMRKRANYDYSILSLGSQESIEKLLQGNKLFETKLTEYNNRHKIQLAEKTRNPQKEKEDQGRLKKAQLELAFGSIQLGFEVAMTNPPIIFYAPYGTYKSTKHTGGDDGDTISLCIFPGLLDSKQKAAKKPQVQTETNDKVSFTDTPAQNEAREKQLTQAQEERRKKIDQNKKLFLGQPVQLASQQKAEQKVETKQQPLSQTPPSQPSKSSVELQSTTSATKPPQQQTQQRSQTQQTPQTQQQTKQQTQQTPQSASSSNHQFDQTNVNNSHVITSSSPNQIKIKLYPSELEDERKNSKIFSLLKKEAVERKIKELKARLAKTTTGIEDSNRLQNIIRDAQKLFQADAFNILEEDILTAQKTVSFAQTHSTQESIVWFQIKKDWPEDSQSQHIFHLFTSFVSYNILQTVALSDASPLSFFTEENQLATYSDLIFESNNIPDDTLGEFKNILQEKRAKSLDSILANLRLSSKADVQELFAKFDEAINKKPSDPNTISSLQNQLIKKDKENKFNYLTITLKDSVSITLLKELQTSKEKDVQEKIEQQLIARYHDLKLINFITVHFSDEKAISPLLVKLQNAKKIQNNEQILSLESQIIKTARESFLPELEKQCEIGYLKKLIRLPDDDAIQELEKLLFTNPKFISSLNKYCENNTLPPLNNADQSLKNFIAMSILLRLKTNLSLNASLAFPPEEVDGTHLDAYTDGTVNLTRTEIVNLNQKNEKHPIKIIGIGICQIGNNEKVLKKNPAHNDNFNDKLNMDILKKQQKNYPQLPPLHLSANSLTNKTSWDSPEDAEKQHQLKGQQPKQPNTEKPQQQAEQQENQQSSQSKQPQSSEARLEKKNDTQQAKSSTQPQNANQLKKQHEEQLMQKQQAIASNPHKATETQQPQQIAPQKQTTEPKQPQPAADQNQQKVQLKQQKPPQQPKQGEPQHQQPPKKQAPTQKKSASANKKLIPTTRLALQRNHLLNTKHVFPPEPRDKSRPDFGSPKTNLPASSARTGSNQSQQNSPSTDKQETESLNKSQPSSTPTHKQEAESIITVRPESFKNISTRTFASTDLESNIKLVNNFLEKNNYQYQLNINEKSQPNDVVVDVINKKDTASPTTETNFSIKDNGNQFQIKGTHEVAFIAMLELFKKTHPNSVPNIKCTRDTTKNEWVKALSKVYGEDDKYKHDPKFTNYPSMIKLEYPIVVPTLQASTAKQPAIPLKKN